jgi:hypothetical protein
MNSYSIRLIGLVSLLPILALAQAGAGSLQITNSTLPVGIVSQPYTATQLTASGGSGSGYVFSTLEGGLPAGFTLSSAGVLQGTPSIPGPNTLLVRVTDSVGASATRQYSITVTNFECPNPVAFTGSSYSSIIFASPFAPIAFAITSGQLPTGFNLQAGQGAISGTSNAEALFNFTVQATNGAGLTVSRACRIEVQSTLHLTSARTTARVGVPYRSVVSASGGQGSYSYSLSGGALPAGLTLNTANGLITGTPTQAGTATYRIQAQDSQQKVGQREFSLYVLARDFTPILRCPLPGGAMGSVYNSGVSLNGAGNVSFSIDGEVPPGLSFDTATGRLTGTILDSGSYHFGVTATGLSSGPVTASCQILVSGGPPPPLHVACPDQTDLVRGEAYASPAIASGGLRPYTYSLYQSELPSGLSLNPVTGLVSGTAFSVPQVFSAPSGGDGARYATDPFYYLIRVVDGAGNAAITDPFCSNTLADPPPPTITTTSLPQGGIGGAYSTIIQTSGGLPALSMQVSGALPPGLALSVLNGVFRISGTPTQVGVFSFTLVVTDSLERTSNRALQLEILNSNPPLITTTSLPPGTVSTPYSTVIQTSGGLPALSMQASGVLPTGLSLNVTNGVFRISGTPTQVGVFTFSLLLTDSLNRTNSRSFQVEISNLVSEPLRFTSSVLDFGTVGLEYGFTLQASGGAPPYRFGLKSGSLPPGISLAAEGRLRGVPTTASTYRFELEVMDNQGSRVENGFSIIVFQGSFRIGCPSPGAELGVPYSSMATVLGGAPPYNVFVAAGSLPGGLSLDSASGAVSGRPNAGGLFTFTLGVTDSRQGRTQAQCSIGVQQGPLRILTEGPISSLAGAPYSGQMEQSGGQAPFTWTLLSGAPEAGMVLAPNGSFTGTATKKGSYSLNVRVADGAGASVSKVIVLNAADSTVRLACPEQTQLRLGVASSGSFVLSGGLAPYRVSILSGGLPTGLTLGSAGAFSGQPTALGLFPVQMQVVDDTETVNTASCQFEVTGDPFTITTEVLPNSTAGVSYSAGLSTSGGIGRIRYGMSSGSLPEGLELDANTGAISGIPVQGGSFSVGFSATDELRRRANKTFSVVIADGTRPLRITTGSPLPDGFVGRAYATSFAVDGGKGPYAWTISGVPEGLSVAGETISGSPTQAGEFTVSVAVRDAAGATATKSFSLLVKTAGLNITTERLPDAVTGEPYSPGVAAEGGRPPLTWSILNGSIPEGVSFDPVRGAFEGVASRSGQFALTIEVTDAAGAVSRKSYGFEVRPLGVEPLAITTATLPNGNAGVAYRVTLGASGGRGPYTWSLNGDLPPGLSFNADGSIGGTPTSIGTFGFLASVTDSLGLKATRLLSLRVAFDTVPSLSIEGLPDTSTSNQNLSFTVRAASAFGVPVSGRITLSFVPDGHGADDPAIRFANTTRTLDFTIPAGSTAVTITPGNPAFATGTLAGTIRLDTALSFAGATAAGPTRSVTIRRAVSVITSLQLTRGAGSIEIRINGFTNTRQLAEARVTFTASGSVDLTTSSQLTVNVQQAIQAWFASAASQPFGGQFSLTLPFTVSGDAANLTGVSVTITNSEGSSNPATAN